MVVYDLTICGHCLRTLRVNGERLVGALSDDTRSLSALQLGKLRQARKSARESNV